MNTPGSVAYGWGVLIVAAGVAYHFAKKDIDAKRREQAALGIRPEHAMTWEERVKMEEMKQRQLQQQQQQAASGAADGAGRAGSS
ncbi:hypothetical protein AMAG_20058 [Allomyces macrogynus ATCC 38327]|uniref:Uncharacterized protein n=1 Tax=Allomyces macrogynus (strain ATCC 38327) TaxID=578462 RepID=A0A0L0T557_ALLM3|nr:hypothetical protein AMAG_20058 [Allomyces macrogynus ATCC 38327]|eukprot:KNE69841.1 hypothetical protein AMAG_20058 [Allomyces macrogynus ATCC 38327]